MGTSAADDPGPEGRQIDETLNRLSDRIQEWIDRVKPTSPDRWKRGIKIVLTVLLTVMYVYWVLTYQFDVQWFNF